VTNANASTDDEGIVILENFDCSKEELWELITDADELSAWLGGTCVIEPDVGGLVRFELPDDGLVATGVVREWSPPISSRSVAAIEHTFVDQAQPNVTYVCNWVLSASGSGCDLRFSLEGVDESDRARLAGPWRRLGASRSAHRSEPKRRTTTADQAMSLLRLARSILLISWVTEDIPRSLVEAGFSVISKNGPEPDNYGRAEIRDGVLEFTRVEPPTRADLVHLDWTSGFEEYLGQAGRLGARTFWYHSAKTKAPAPADVRGCWVPAPKSARLRAAVEAEGISYIDDHYIVDIARRLLDETP
jgi:hypothetical protein